MIRHLDDDPVDFRFVIFRRNFVGPKHLPPSVVSTLKFEPAVAVGVIKLSFSADRRCTK
jgi:hypothetical protein